MIKGNKGFTLIELIVVILLLSILVAVALPKFIDLSSSAREAVTDALSESLAEGVAKVHGQWLAAGGTAATTVTMPDSTILYFGATGYPTNAGSALAQTAMTVESCTAVWDGLLQNAPTIGYTVTVASNVCSYTDSSSHVITYSPVTGVVSGTKP